jgi:hypothetical protein
MGQHRSSLEGGAVEKWGASMANEWIETLGIVSGGDTGEQTGERGIGLADVRKVADGYRRNVRWPGGLSVASGAIGAWNSRKGCGIQNFSS